MAPISLIMHRHGFRILRYRDDWLVLGSSLEEIVRGEGLFVITVQRTRCLSQPRQEFPHAYTNHRLPGDVPSVNSFEGFPDAGQDLEGALSGLRVCLLTCSAAASPAVPLGGHVLSDSSHSGCSSAHAFPPVAPHGCGSTAFGPGAVHLGRLLPPGSSVVVRHQSSCGRGLSIFLSRSSCCSPTLQIPAGVPLSGPTTYQAYGFRTSRPFPSTIASSWPFFMQSGVSFIFTASRCCSSQTTPRLWPASASKVVLVRRHTIPWLSPSCASASRKEFVCSLSLYLGSSTSWQTPSAAVPKCWARNCIFARKFTAISSAVGRSTSTSSHTSMNHQLLVYFSPVLDPQALTTDAVSRVGTASRRMPSLRSASFPMSSPRFTSLGISKSRLLLRTGQ